MMLLRIPPVLSAFLAALNVIVLFLAGAILLTAVIFHFLPELSRHEIFFAVTVQPVYRKTTEARLIMRRFRLAVWIHTLIALGIAFAGIASEHFLMPLLGVFWLIGGATIAFLRARKRVLPHATSQTSLGEASLARRSTGTIYWTLQVGPFAILCGCAAYLHANWQRIPERFPIDWGLVNQPNGWATRSFTGIYWPLLIGFIVCVFLAVFSYGIIHWTRHIRSRGPAALAEARSRRIQVGVMLAIQYLIAWVFGRIPFTALRPNTAQAPRVWPFLILIAAFVLILLVVLMYAGQGGANLAQAGSEPEITPQRAPIGDRTPDQCWRGGIFYVNPNDPALLVEKRFGLGYTFNFARPAAWVLMAAILAFVIVVPLLTSLLAK